MIQSHLTCVNMCQHIFQHISSLSAQVLIVEAVEPREVPHHLKPHVLIERDGLGPSQWSIEWHVTSLADGQGATLGATWPGCHDSCHEFLNEEFKLDTVCSFFTFFKNFWHFQVGFEVQYKDVQSTSSYFVHQVWTCPAVKLAETYGQIMEYPNSKYNSV